MTTPQTQETVRRIQWGMASCYSGLGAWCLFHPASVIALGFTPSYAIFNRTTSLLTRCFGAQAMTAGLLLATSDMTAKSFTIFGAAMVPYLGFNAWFGIGPGRGVLTKLLWLDFVGNLIFLSGSLFAAKLLRDDEEDQKKQQ
ncbi:hypothetical protein B0J14DRAFT_610598 [Halenospora varia]|nr:hypothetical protein B0J14DRAFT_610598 [Halenospora varia]